MAKSSLRPKPTVEKCPTCGAPMIRWPDGSSGCTRDHATAKEIIEANEQHKGDDK